MIEPITWQARENKNSDYKNVQSIYNALASNIVSQGGTVEFSMDGTYQKKPDAVIVSQLPFVKNNIRISIFDLSSPAEARQDKGILILDHSVSGEEHTRAILKTI